MISGVEPRHDFGVSFRAHWCSQCKVLTRNRGCRSCEKRLCGKCFRVHSTICERDRKRDRKTTICAACFTRFPNLLRHVVGCLDDCPREIATFVSSCQSIRGVPRIPLNLESIPQDGLKWWQYGLKWKDHYALRGLNLRSACNGDLAIIATCASLQILNLKECNSLDGVLDMAPLASCQSLHTLNLTGCHAAVDVSGLARSSSLHTLILRSCDGVQDVAALALSTSLSTLDLSWCCVKELAPLGQCISLRELKLLRNMTVRKIAGLAHCPSLHTLELHGCTQIIDVASLGKSRSLHTLNLSYCEQVSHIDVEAVSQCPTLQMLDLTCCKRFPDFESLQSNDAWVVVVAPAVEVKHPHGSLWRSSTRCGGQASARISIAKVQCGLSGRVLTLRRRSGVSFLALYETSVV